MHPAQVTVSALFGVVVSTVVYAVRARRLLRIADAAPDDDQGHDPGRRWSLRGSLDTLRPSLRDVSRTIRPGVDLWLVTVVTLAIVRLVPSNSPQLLSPWSVGDRIAWRLILISAACGVAAGWSIGVLLFWLGRKQILRARGPGS